MIFIPILSFALASSFFESTSAQTVIVTLGHTINVGSSMAVNIDGTRLTSGTTKTVGSVPVFISKSNLMIGSTTVPIPQMKTGPPTSKETNAPKPRVTITSHSILRPEESSSSSTSHTVLPIPIPVPGSPPKNGPPGKPPVNPPQGKPPGNVPPILPGPPALGPPSFPPTPHFGLPDPFPGGGSPKPESGPDPKPGPQDNPPNPHQKPSSKPTRKPSSSHSPTKHSSSHSTKTTTSATSCRSKTVSACTTIYLPSQHRPHTTICSQTTTHCSATCNNDICSHTSFTVAPMQTDDGTRYRPPPAVDAKEVSAQAIWMQHILNAGETSKLSSSTKSSKSTTMVKPTKATETAKVVTEQAPTGHVNPTIGNPTDYVLTWKPAAASAGPECQGGYCPQGSSSSSKR